MHKFEEKQGCCGLYIYNKSSSTVFGIQAGFWIKKENSKGSSDVLENNSYFDYHGLSNVYLSNSATKSPGVNFTPKRITVIQMK